MRVVQVSAHYPPNFTSGGTLVPQRIAQGLARRGHESLVYAGHLDPAREPLSAWDEAGDDGVSVRWIVTTPWTGWADRRNFDNPEVVEDFSAWLDRVRPDVVHLHSLQTLGGAMVAAAGRSGARVVVTMHDFWWCCARQFLVDRDVHPCSLVVDCGSCDCQVDHAWLLDRNRRLAADLEHADLVLAPSRSAARVLAANGVDPDKLRVDENGVLDVSAAQSPGPTGGPRAGGVGLRLLFAGGEDPMKGLPVLLRALPLVSSARPWSIDLYGVTRPVDHPAARALPAFAPGELGAVLATHDVLVLPSVMRESHSIVTREALAAGLAVVCTDSLGPEEAVVDGRNGLVVRSDDDASLARAVQRLVDDPELVAQLRRGTASYQPRSVDDQVEGLVERYAELLADRAAEQPESDRVLAAATGSLVRRVLFVVGIGGAPLRYRAQLPAEALNALGLTADVRHYRDPEVRDLAATADAVVFYRVPATAQILELAAAIRARPRRVPMLFDVDDLIVDPGLRGQVHGLEGMSPPELDLWWRGVDRYRTTLELCDGYIGSTQALCEHVGALTGLPTYRFANGVGTHLARIAETELRRPRAPGPLRIGYFSGTTTHDADWALVEPAVAAVMRRHPDVELWLGGPLAAGAELVPFADRVHRLPLLPWTALPARMRDVDVNLAPLVPNSVFNEAKSAIKWLEAALVETPTVASPTEPFREAVESGRTGMLAANRDEWEQALETLLTDADARERMGSQARREALLRWSPALQGRVYLGILRAAVLHNLRSPEPASAWQPVVDDEPWTVAARGWVDPYPAGRVTRPVHPWARGVRALGRVMRDEGPAGVARRVRSRLR